MTYKLSIKAGSMAVLEAFHNNKLDGVTVRHEPKEPPAKELKLHKPTMAFDSAEDILHLIIEIAVGIEVNLVSNWLYANATKPSKKKTYINGFEIPKEHEELVLLIKSLLNAQKEGQDKSILENKANSPTGTKTVTKKKLTPEKAQDRKKVFAEIIQKIHEDKDKQKEAFVKNAKGLLKPLPVSIEIEDEASDTGIVFSIPDCEEVIGYKLNYSDYLGRDIFQEILEKLSNPDGVCEIAVKVYTLSLNDITEAIKEHKKKYDEHFEKAVDLMADDDISGIAPSSYLYKHGNAIYRLATIKEQFISKHYPSVVSILDKSGKYKNSQ